MSFLANLKKFAEKAFSAVLIAGIMAIMIGSILLIITFTVLNSVLAATGNIANTVLNSTQSSVIASIGQGLTITGISLIVIGIAIIIYTLLPIASSMSGGRGR
jgi:hypothetical protein